MLPHALIMVWDNACWLSRSCTPTAVSRLSSTVPASSLPLTPSAYSHISYQNFATLLRETAPKPGHAPTPACATQPLATIHSGAYEMIPGLCRPSASRVFRTQLFTSCVRRLTRAFDRFTRHTRLIQLSTSKPLHAVKSYETMIHATKSEPPHRISQTSLLFATIILLCVAGFVIPGGLTPRRVKQQILAKRVAEHLDVISEHDPEEVLGGPLAIEKIHRDGIFHRGVWIFALDSHLRLLLSWRAPSMKTCPMTWSTLGEHAIANETFEEAAERGLAEEASFVVRPRTYSIGQPFVYNYIYSMGTSEQRTDNQWTQAYIVLPRGDALDFRTLDDREAEQAEPGAENLRYQGMSLAEVVRHAVQKPKYFCNVVQVKWILRIIPLVIRVIKVRDKRLFRGYLKEDWAKLVASGSPVCCHESEHVKEVNEVNISMCGVPCEPHTVEESDKDALT